MSAANLRRLPDPPEPEHEIITISEFARRVYLKPGAIYKRIRLNQMPAGCVVRVLGRYMIDWTLFKCSGIQRIN